MTSVLIRNEMLQTHRLEERQEDKEIKIKKDKEKEKKIKIKNATSRLRERTGVNPSCMASEELNLLILWFKLQPLEL